MYSVVLMVAMTGGADVPAGLFGHGGCCGGYSDCYGCYGCSGCWGGCYGSSCHGGHGFFGGHKHHGHGCCGGYDYGCCGGYAYSCYGCCGGYDYGCCGGGHHHHRGHHHHGHGCCGGCYGGCYGGWGCCGGYNCCGSVNYGCCGGWSCVGAPVAPVAPGAAPSAPAEKLEQKPVEKKEEVRTAAPATLIVSVPAEATLTIDDAATASKAARRVFVSPSLPAGREFVYTLKAEFSKDGKPVIVTRDVTVTAGAEIEVTLDTGLAGVASR